MNYILDRESLVARRMVVPKEVTASKILTRLTDGEMPPDGEMPRPSAAEFDELKHWIEAEHR